jgi:hypothetical protein
MSENKPQPTHGDLVRVNGYGNRVFQVESYYDQRWYYVDENWTDRIYELFDMGGGEWIEADATDLTLITDASQADEYLRANPAPIENAAPDFSQYLYGIDFASINGGGNEMMKPNQPERKPTARELSGQEAERRKQARKDRKAKIDACLDWMNYYREQGGADAEAKVAEIKQELAELVAEGDGR